MIQTGALREVGGELIPTDQWMDEGDARRFHTVIAGGGSRAIIDSVDGEVIATASGREAAGRAMFVGGRFRRVVQSAAGEVYLERPRGSDAQRALAVLPAARGRHGLSRPIVWAMAEAAGVGSRIWRRKWDSLVTWAGEAAKRVLAWLPGVNSLDSKRIAY